MKSFINQIESDINLLSSENLYRKTVDTARIDGIKIIRDNKQLISFSCNDYLGFTQNKQVKQAAIAAIEQYGSGSGASRLITGNHPLYTLLERLLADIKHSQDALVFGSGYLANIGVICALMNKNDLIIADKNSHSCLIDGAKLSGATLVRFKHNDIDDCAKQIAKYRSKHNKCMIISENVFSMDGDLAPIDALYELATKNNSILLTDDAHGLGVVKYKFRNRPHIQMGTLSKAIGSYGGYVCANKQIIDYIKNKAKTLIFSTSLPPSVIAASICALEILQENSGIIEEPLRKAQEFTNLIKINEAVSPIVSIIIGDAKATIEASSQLENDGFYVGAIRPPTVAKNTSRIRLTFSALHEHGDIVKLADSIIRKDVVNG